MYLVIFAKPLNSLHFISELSNKWFVYHLALFTKNKLVNLYLRHTQTQLKSPDPVVISLCCAFVLRLKAENKTVLTDILVHVSALRISNKIKNFIYNFIFEVVFKVQFKIKDLFIEM